MNFEEIRKQNWDEGENGLYEIIKNYEQNDLAALAVNYFNDLCTKRIESEILKAENEELKDRCNYIWAIGCDYDGANPNDATQMRQLADELVGIAVDGLEQTVFCNDEKTEIQPRAVKLRNLKAENARLTEQLKNAVVLPYIRCVKGEWQLVRELGDYVTTIIYGKDMILAEQMLAELGGKE